jgi:hypothetical protein
MPYQNCFHIEEELRQELLSLLSDPLLSDPLRQLPLNFLLGRLLRM